MSASCLCPEDEKKSVYRECAIEVAKHKWIESQKAGYDLGEAAIRQWVREHWYGFLRSRWVEHLQGTCFWVELDHGDYGILLREFQDRPHLLNTILEQLKAGQENLGVICWAHDCRISFEPVIQILEALDVNGSRLVHQFDPLPPMPPRK
jgi:hypothetical protein